MTVSLYFVSLVFLFTLLIGCLGNEDVRQQQARDRLKQKNVIDYTDADIESLYDQWEEHDDPLEDDELPEWKRPSPKIDLSKMDLKNPENLLKMSKKGKTTMMFATVAEQSDSEVVSSLWQSGLYNGNIDVQRYVVASNRVLFVLRDGSQAWDVKDYLVQQENCVEVSLDGKDYKGKGALKKETSSKGKKTVKTDL